MRRLKESPWLRRGAFALAVGGTLAAIGMTPFGPYVERLSIDVLIPIRTWIGTPPFPPQQSDVVVVAIDEQTYRTKPFDTTPKIAWTPFLGEVIQAVDAAGSKVIGFDIVFPTSLDQPNLLQGYDRPFLQALAKAGRQGRLVLGEARFSGERVLPYPGQLVAAGRKNLRSLNLKLDPDDVVRRYPVSWETEAADGARTTSFAAELALRAGADPPTDEFLINYVGSTVEVPTYSFVDLWHCAQQGNTAYFADHFKDKVVLFGEVLDLEDRRTPASRWALGKDVPTGERCTVAASDAFTPVVARTTIPGVYIHAAAVNTITKGIALKTVGATTGPVLVGLGSAALGIVLFLVGPAVGLAVLGGTLAALLAGSVGAFQHNIVLPLLPLAGAAVVTYGATYAFRFIVEDREKRRIRNAFRHYLAPVLVDRLARDPKALRLGGEERRITVFFSDIAGFTTITESMRETPGKLVEILNRYLTVMSAAIERNGGYIDKFIGDAVMAIWNAPLDDHEAERHAVAAAIECVEGLALFNRDVVGGEYGLPPIGTRIGIATGVAIVGNMGSTSRFNYTVTGDIVNLAARLEGANKEYGTTVMIHEATAKGLDRSVLLRRLDRLVVKGKTVPVKVFEVLGRAEGGEAKRPERVTRFHAALALYYRRAFAEAAEAFAALAGEDKAAGLYRDRCRHYMDNPPPERWNRAFQLTTK